MQQNDVHRLAQLLSWKLARAQCKRPVASAKASSAAHTRDPMPGTNRRISRDSAARARGRKRHSPFSPPQVKSPRQRLSAWNWGRRAASHPDRALIACHGHLAGKACWKQAIGEGGVSPAGDLRKKKPVNEL
jgi:hypothetical protein